MWKAFAIILFCCQSIYAQETISYKELIVKVPDLTEWKAYKIQRQLACLDGLRYLGYFKERSCLLFHVDTKKIIDRTIITTIIHHLNGKMKTDVINGVTIYEVLDDKLSESKKTLKK